MRCFAVIDLGTNTFHLLIVRCDTDGQPQVIHREHQAVKLGKAGISQGFIARDARERALAALLRFSDQIARHHITEVHAFGTSAFRSASNSAELVAEIKSATGISVQVITGDQEAELIFQGVRAAMNVGPELSLAMDIGAGSVEFIIGNEGGIYWKRSYEIGGQRLLEKFHKHDPILKQEIRLLDQWFDQSLQSLVAALRDYRPSVLIGVSGTFDTLSEIYSIREGLPPVHDSRETPLTHAGFIEIHEELIRKNRGERMQIQGMIEMRVDMIVVTSCLIRWLVDKHSFTRLRVSSWSLKEGAMMQLARGNGLAWDGTATKS